MPDPDLSLRDAADFIFDTTLCRKALTAPSPPSLGVFLRDVIAGIYRLTMSCHLPEFTDHGLQHLCSLVDRLSRWTSPTSGHTAEAVVAGVDPAESAVLLLATLFHDIGMLSQRQEDLPEPQSQWESKGRRDIPDWVRATHVERMEKLVKRLFSTGEFSALLDTPVLQRAFIVARAHAKWPWQWPLQEFVQRDAGLAAMLAVADLLDEDSNRCDTAMLLRHRQGNYLNCAHWIRHSLSGGRVLVEAGNIRVPLLRPPSTDGQLAPVFRALRNHYRLSFLYLRELGQINAGLLNMEFRPTAGCPAEVSDELADWRQLPGFGTQAALSFQLLNSFMPQALLDSQRLQAEEMQRLKALGLEDVDLQEFRRIRGTLEFHSREEQTFQALLGGND